MEWVDAQIHLLPPEWCKSDFQPPLIEETAIRLIFGQPDRDAVLPLASAEAAIEEMDRAGITKALVMGLPWRTSAMNWRNNDYIRHACDMWPDRFIGFGILPPPQSEDLRQAVGRLQDEYGFCGIYALPAWLGLSLDDPAFAPMLEEMTARRLFLYPHTEHPYKSPETTDTTHALYNVICRYPDLRVIASHLGGLLCLYGLHPPIAEKIKNVLFVGSMPATMRMITYAIDAIGADRVAFGTDFPFNPSHDIASLRDETKALGLEDADLRKVAGAAIIDFLKS